MLPEGHEAIVVGAIGAGAPWFLTEWVEGTEVEFMIDTKCQVTILATAVFERMCAKDPLFGARLLPLRVTGHDYCVPGLAVRYGAGCRQHWLRGTVGDRSLVILFASSTSPYGAIVG